MKKIIFLIVLILSVGIANSLVEQVGQIISSEATNVVMGELTKQGLVIPTPDAIINEQFSQLTSQLAEKNPGLVEIIGTGQTAQAVISNPAGFVSNELASEFLSKNPEVSKLASTAAEFQSYANQLGLEEYKLNYKSSEEEAIIETGEITYPGGNEVVLKGVEMETGKISCSPEEKDCEVQIGKNTYSGIDETQRSNIELNNDGSIKNAELTINEQTQLYFGDRAYTVQPGTKVNYNLIKDKAGKEYYEVTVTSQSEQGVDISFPNLDANGKPILNNDQNYKIKNGNVKFTTNGIEVYKGTTIEDLKLKYELTNHGNNPVLIVSDRSKIPKSNYLLANNDEFEFNLQQTDISIKNQNKWGLNVPQGESFDISIEKQGSGYLGGFNEEKGLSTTLERQNVALVNTGGEFKIKNCNSNKLMTSTEIIETDINKEKSLFNNACTTVNLVTNTKDLKNLVVENVQGVQVCSTSNQQTTGSFIKVSGREILSPGLVMACSVGVTNKKSSTYFQNKFDECSKTNLQNPGPCRGKILEECANQVGVSSERFSIEQCVILVDRQRGKDMDPKAQVRCKTVDDCKKINYLYCETGYCTNVKRSYVGTTQTPAQEILSPLPNIEGGSIFVTCTLISDGVRCVKAVVRWPGSYIKFNRNENNFWQAQKLSNQGNSRIINCGDKTNIRKNTPCWNLIDSL